MSKGNDTAAHVEVLRSMIRIDQRQLRSWLNGTAKTCGGVTKDYVEEAKALYRRRIAALEAAVAALEAPAVMAAKIETMACPRCGWEGEALPEIGAGAKALREKE